MLKTTQKKLTSNKLLNKYLLSDVNLDDIVSINDTQRASIASIIIDEYNECRLTDDELDMIFTRFRVKENIEKYNFATKCRIYSLLQYSDWLVKTDDYETIRLSMLYDDVLR
jgi:hypothetical protein